MGFFCGCLKSGTEKDTCVYTCTHISAMESGVEVLLQGPERFIWYCIRHNFRQQYVLNYELFFLVGLDCVDCFDFLFHRGSCKCQHIARLIVHSVSSSFFFYQHTVHCGGDCFLMHAENDTFK